MPPKIRSHADGDLAVKKAHTVLCVSLSAEPPWRISNNIIKYERKKKNV